MSHHLSDEDLIAHLDGETTKTWLHLATCDECCDRLAAFQQASASLRHLFHANAELPQIPVATHARARLAAQLIAPSPAWNSMPRAPWLRYASLAAALTFTALATLTILRPSLLSRPLFAKTIPNTSLTPGVARPVELDDICRVHADTDDDQDPAVPSDTQQAVFREYGLSGASASSYQVDYLINPQLGGTADIHNLWPEPYRADWNAHAKDALESRMHQMVCARQLSLADAQQQIAADWIAAYKKYFHTSRPIA